MKLTAISHQLAIVDTCAAVVLSSSSNRPFLVLTMVPRFPIPEGVDAKFITPLYDDTALASSIFNDILPKALAAGSFIPAPAAHVAGHRLEAIQGAMDVFKDCVSAKKIVVTL